MPNSKSLRRGDRTPAYLNTGTLITSATWTRMPLISKIKRSRAPNMNKVDAQFEDGIERSTPGQTNASLAFSLKVQKGDAIHLALDAAILKGETDTEPGNVIEVLITDVPKEIVGAKGWIDVYAVSYEETAENADNVELSVTLTPTVAFKADGSIYKRTAYETPA